MGGARPCAPPDLAGWSDLERSMVRQARPPAQRGLPRPSAVPGHRRRVDGGGAPRPTPSSPGARKGA
eukprot:15454621-Alexandrium_andersonii.AAC.2